MNYIKLTSIFSIEQRFIIHPSLRERNSAADRCGMVTVSAIRRLGD
jgi:sulfur relay (sulfurtransferase) DsrF/TusC family protein